MVTDVALLPLTSQHEADEAIKSALGSSESASDDSDSNVSDTDNEHSDQVKTAQASAASADDIEPYQSKNSSTTSVAEDVATRNVSFGKFASQWLSRQKWPASKASANQDTTESTEPKPASKDDPLLEDLAKSKESKQSGEAEDPKLLVKPAASSSTTSNLLPRILKTTKMIFTSGSYFFSYDIDLTRRFEHLEPANRALDFKKLDPLVSD